MHCCKFFPSQLEILCVSSSVPGCFTLGVSQDRRQSGRGGSICLFFPFSEFGVGILKLSAVDCRLHFVSRFLPTAIWRFWARSRQKMVLSHFLKSHQLDALGRSDSYECRAIHPTSADIVRDIMPSVFKKGAFIIGWYHMDQLKIAADDKRHEDSLLFRLAPEGNLKYLNLDYKF